MLDGIRYPLYKISLAEQYCTMFFTHSTLNDDKNIPGCNFVMVSFLSSHVIPSYSVVAYFNRHYIFGASSQTLDLSRNI